MKLGDLTETEAQEIYDRISWMRSGINSAFDFTRPRVRVIMEAIANPARSYQNDYILSREILQIVTESNRIVENIKINKDAVTLQDLSDLQVASHVYYSNIYAPEIRPFQHYRRRGSIIN